jgi:hypothetical protein
MIISGLGYANLRQTRTLPYFVRHYFREFRFKTAFKALPKFGGLSLAKQPCGRLGESPQINGPIPVK